MTLQDTQKLDNNDPLAPFRKEFHFPKMPNNKECLYFCGNSLGLQTKETSTIVNEELEKWRNFGVEGHFEEPRPWLSFHKNFESTISKLVGAQTNEVVTMNGLTVNLNLLLLSFYNPTSEKFKIVIEKNAFPSDHYAVASQVDLLYQKGVLTKQQAENAIIYLEPDEWGVYSTENILNQLQDKEICTLLLSGVNYQTGQVFEMQKISNSCQQQKITIGLDLAHAIGNVELKLHDWGVDFAIWCTYKYLNGGPGSVGGAFVHDKNINAELPRLHGWWSNKESNRFEMKSEVEPYPTAEAWQMSNAPVLSMASLLGSLNLFDKVDYKTYYKKGQDLSDYLAKIIQQKLPEVKIVTPLENKGCQLSIFIDGKDKNFTKELLKNGVIADWRNHKKGGILRVAPVPFYNSFKNCWDLVLIIEKLLRNYST